MLWCFKVARWVPVSWLHLLWRGKSFRMGAFRSMVASSFASSGPNLVYLKQDPSLSIYFSWIEKARPFWARRNIYIDIFHYKKLSYITFILVSFTIKNYHIYFVACVYGEMHLILVTDMEVHVLILYRYHLDWQGSNRVRRNLLICFVLNIYSIYLFQLFIFYFFYL